MSRRKRYPSDSKDEEWAFVAPYLALMTEDAPQRRHRLRDVYDALKWLVKTGSPWRYLPGDFPPWEAVYQQSRRWLEAGVFEAMTHDLRMVLRVSQGRAPDPSAAVMGGRTLQSTPESGSRAGYDGYKRKKGSKVHAAVDTLGNLLAGVTPANKQERAQGAELAKRVREATGESVELSFVDQGSTGDQPRRAAGQGIDLVVVKQEGAKRGFVLLPRRWVVERSFAWSARFKRLLRDSERLLQVLAGLHGVAFSVLLLTRLLPMFTKVTST
ncbi:MAG TPA: IS5 family transposase [Trueperaceae bacterium]